MVGWEAAIVVATGAFLGMALQRSVGLGFAITAAPIFSHVLGPFGGVLLANALAIPVAASVLLTTRRGFDIRRFYILAGFGLLAVLPGAFVARELDGRWLQILSGSLILIILLLQVWHRKQRSRSDWDSIWAAPAAGTACGFLNATAGAGGPPVAIYGAATGWKPSSSVPTMQLTFITVNVASLLFKGLPTLEISAALFAVAGLVAGLLAAGFIVRLLSQETLVRGALSIAFLGSSSLLITGIAALL